MQNHDSEGERSATTYIVYGGIATILCLRNDSTISPSPPAIFSTSCSDTDSPASALANSGNSIPMGAGVFSETPIIEESDLKSMKQMGKSELQSVAVKSTLNSIQLHADQIRHDFVLLRGERGMRGEHEGFHVGDCAYSDRLLSRRSDNGTLFQEGSRS